MTYSVNGIQPSLIQYSINNHQSQPIPFKCYYLFIVSHYMFRPTCRPSSGVADKITSNGSVTDYPSVDPPSPDIYGIIVFTANVVEIISKEA
jgi:hypothetical protein